MAAMKDEREASYTSADSSSRASEQKQIDDDETNRQEAIATLAQSLSESRAHSGRLQNPFNGQSDSALDPHSPDFRAEEWVKNMIKMTREDEKDARPMTGGVSFTGLSAFGRSASIDYQQNVGNVWLKIVDVLRKAVGLPPAKDRHPTQSRRLGRER